jgi:hypothetical protein
VTEVVEGVLVEDDALVLAPDGAPIFSASQVDTFRLCKRKWAWRYLDGIKVEAHPSAQLGTEVHRQAEAWLREGKPPLLTEGTDFEKKAGLILMSGLHLLPSPRTCEVERPFVIEFFGFRFRGFKDFERGPQTHRHNGAWISGFVGDHKTSTDPSKWGKTAAELFDDTQAIIYAAEHLHRFDAPSVELHWNYLKTSGSPKATPVLDLGGSRPIVRRGDCEPVLERTYEAAKEMAAIHARVPELHVAPHALSLEPNPSACEAFGGCPHKERCNLTPNDKIRSLFKMNDKEALLAKMQGNPQLPPAGPPAGPSINPPTAMGAFVDGAPFYDGTVWIAPDNPAYVAWKAFFASKTPVVPTPALETQTGTVAQKSFVIQAAEVSAAQAPATNGASNGVPTTEQHLTEGLKRRGRPKKVQAPATGESKYPALAYFAQAIIELGEALAELADG